MKRKGNIRKQVSSLAINSRYLTKKRKSESFDGTVVELLTRKASYIPSK